MKIAWPNAFPLRWIFCSQCSLNLLKTYPGLSMLADFQRRSPRLELQNELWIDLIRRRHDELARPLSCRLINVTEVVDSSRSILHGQLFDSEPPIMWQVTSILHAHGQPGPLSQVVAPTCVTVEQQLSGTGWGNLLCPKFEPATCSFRYGSCCWWKLLSLSGDAQNRLWTVQPLATKRCTSQCWWFYWHKSIKDRERMRKVHHPDLRKTPCQRDNHCTVQAAKHTGTHTYIIFT